MVIECHVSVIIVIDTDSIILIFYLQMESFEDYLVDLLVTSSNAE